MFQQPSHFRQFLCQIARIIFVVYCTMTAAAVGRCVSENATESGSFDVCPSKCNCTNVTMSIKYSDEKFEGFRVNCTSRDLAKVPDNLPSNTTELLLGDNNIRNLTVYSLLGCHQLAVLNISINILTAESVASNAFSSNMSQLRELYMNDNHFRVSNISQSLFDGLEGLRVLHIHNNERFRDQAYNDQLFSRLVGIRELVMDGIRNVSFGAGFSKLVNLLSLRVHAGLFRVLNDTFASFAQSSVKNLALTGNYRLTATEALAFAHFRHLENLEIIDNERVGIVSLSKALFGLNCTNISTLNVINTDRTSYYYITSEFMKYLKPTNLTTLALVKNNIHGYIEPNVSKYLPHLEHLDLSNNRIDFKRNFSAFLFDLWALRRLRYLDLSNQLPSSSSRDSSAKFLQADELAMNGERLRWPESGLNHLTNDMQLTNRCIGLPPRLKVLKMNSIHRSQIADIPHIIVFGGSQLQLAEFRQNGVKKITGPIIFTHMTKNLTLDLSNNHISYISPNVFRISAIYGSIIRELKLADNDLGGQILNDTAGEMFLWFKGLEVLNLVRNQIKSIPKDFFKHTTTLRVLKLGSNWLHSIGFDMTPMNNLQMLNLTNNKLATIDERSASRLTEMMSHNAMNLTVDLLGNPIGCSCGDLPLLHWLRDNRGHFLNYQLYTCSFNASSEATTNVKNISLSNMEYECSKRLVLVVTGSSFMVVILLVASSVCCYRYRWEVRYSCLKLTQRSKKYQMLIEMERDFDYDAFVSYDSADRQWVNSQLLPNLEGHPIVENSINQVSYHPIRLCVHERDFPPGEDIIGNIWNKMERSRKTILVLSRAFNASNYCNYEVQLARMNSVEQARNLIIPVLLEPINIEEMSDCLKWIVRKLTYIEWPEHEADKVEFWQKLRDAVAAYDIEFFK